MQNIITKYKLYIFIYINYMHVYEVYVLPCLNQTDFPGVAGKISPF